jgi:hypothetical protein
MSETSEQKLEAEIESVWQECLSRFAALVGSNETGYSSKVLISYIALCVEYENRFAAFMPIAREFDFDKPSAASQRLTALSVEYRQRLKEASYMAAFKVVYEEFDAYIAALPTALPPNAPFPALTVCLDRLIEFEQRFHSFEPRATELAAEGLLTSMQEKWLNPLAEVTHRHIAAIMKRCDDQRTTYITAIMKQCHDQRTVDQLGPQKSVINNNPVVTTGQQYIDAFNTICNEMDAVVNPILAQIDASRGNIWVDTSPLFNSIYDHYQHFLTRIAQLEPAAKELTVQDQPQLMQLVQAKKADVEKCSEIIEQILARRQASNMDRLKIAAGMQNDLQRHNDEMHRMQQSITDSINSYKI